MKGPVTGRDVLLEPKKWIVLGKTVPNLFQLPQMEALQCAPKKWD